MDHEAKFELVREEAPYHECGHYHWPAQACPDARTCTSQLCCVFGGDVETKTE